MNSEEDKDYAQYIIQKHILAIAIAIIKTRPADLSLEAYLNNIRENIQGNMDRHIDVVIREEDFNLSSDDDESNSQDSVNILNNFDLNDFDDPLIGTDEVNTMIEVLNNVQDDFVDENHCTQSTFFNESQKPINIETRKVNEQANNVGEICENYNKRNVNPSDKAKGVINKEVINTTNHNIEIHNLVSNINRNLNNFNESNNDNNICHKSNINKCIHKVEDDITDSQKTVLYTVKGFTCNTHVSQSQDVMVITNNKLLQRSHNVANNTTCEKIDKENIKNNQNIQQSVENENNDAKHTNIYADLIDVDCGTQNMYTEEDFVEFYANNIEILDKNKKISNKIDDFIMIEEQVRSKKHKNDENGDFSDRKRKKINANEKEHSKNSRVRKEVDVRKEIDDFWPFSDTSSNEKLIDETDFQLLSPSPKCRINETRSESFVFQENTHQDMDTFKDSFVLDDDENLAPDSLMQMDTFTDAPNDLMPAINLINQEKQRFNENKDCLSKDTALEFKTILNAEDQFSTGMEFESNCVSQEKRNPNSLERVKLNSDYERTKFSSIKIDLNKTANEFYKNNCTLIENNNPYIEDNSVFDEPFINLSQNVRNFADYKISENVHKTNSNTKSEAFSKNTYNETKEFDSYPEERLNECILNNLAYLENDTEKVYPNANKEFTSISPSKTKEINEINDQNKRTKACISNENTQMVGETENFISDNEENQNSEIVSFKIIEELNKIKSYLNRRERIFSQSNSSDSGFKSSYKSASPHCEARINQSAHCLLSFMSAGQLSDRTTDIADEVSKTLGKLVDRLHEEERCPDFLETLLDKAAAFVKLLYEGNNTEEYVLSKREDTIDRLLLLNRSSHIINFTIQKIIIILENLHSDLDQDVTLELKDIDRAENLGHIFDILEILIKRAKKSNELSQLSQISIQDDDKLKRSSLTEIWKRKWNLTGSEPREGSAKKKCALTKCGEVLNKIIVKAMDGYSLISFAALQCFNLLQN